MNDVKRSARGPDVPDHTFLKWVALVCILSLSLLMSGGSTFAATINSCPE